MGVRWLLCGAAWSHATGIHEKANRKSLFSDLGILGDLSEQVVESFQVLAVGVCRRLDQVVAVLARLADLHVQTGLFGSGVLFAKVASPAHNLRIEATVISYEQKEHWEYLSSDSLIEGQLVFGSFHLCPAITFSCD